MTGPAHKIDRSPLRDATRLGVDLHQEIDRKMAINRNRIWNRDNTGHHVRDKETQPEPMKLKYQSEYDAINNRKTP